MVVCVTSFLLGALFTHWIADSLTLWRSPVTDEHLWTAALYYSILTKGPVQALYFLLSILVLGGTTIFWSFGDGEAGNLMFDGGSIVLYGTTATMYLFTVIPNIANNFSSLPPHQVSESFPLGLRPPALELASNHLVCSVALTGVLILQAGRLWAESSDPDEETAVLQETPVDGPVKTDGRPASLTAPISVS